MHIFAYGKHINRHGRDKGRNYPNRIIKNISIHLEASTSIAPPSAGSLFEAFSVVSMQGLLLNWSACWGSANGQEVLDPWWGKFCILFVLSGKQPPIGKFAKPAALWSHGSFAEIGDSGVSGCFPGNSKGLWKSKWATVRSMGLVSVSMSGIPE